MSAQSIVRQLLMHGLRWLLVGLFGIPALAGLVAFGVVVLYLSYAASYLALSYLLRT